MNKINTIVSTTRSKTQPLEHKIKAEKEYVARLGLTPAQAAKHVDANPKGFEP